MKKFYTTILILLVLKTSFSQTIDKLDEKYGYKDIKLGKNISYYGDQVEYFSEDGYRFIGDCCKTVFGMQTTDIILTVDASKNIIRIDIAVETYDKAVMELGYIPKQFKGLFGKQTYVHPDNKTSDFNWLWKGNTTYLIVQEKYLGFKDGWVPLITVGKASDISLDDGF